MFLTIRALFNSVFKPEITLGEVIAISMTLISSLSIVGVWLRRWFVSANPFVLVFLGKNPDSPKSKVKKIEGELGLMPQKHVIEILLRHEDSFEKINIRFVERHWNIFNSRKEYWKLKPSWEWKNAPKEVIFVKSLHDPVVAADFEATGRRFTFKDDGEGGNNGFYNPVYSLPKTGSLCLTIKIDAQVKNEWKGYARFQDITGRQKQKSAYGKIIIKNYNYPLEEMILHQGNPNADILPIPRDTR